MNDLHTSGDGRWTLFLFGLRAQFEIMVGWIIVDDTPGSFMMRGCISVQPAKPAAKSPRLKSREYNRVADPSSVCVVCMLAYFGVGRSIV
jgi:hypothetical protein